ncbi:uncharacterized protein PITG_13303 [Phytophthora infestans T30-4]|uniref:SprT-like domain-containing protein n=1 Tax=Phytophthora infestans (strain T30-4) TaxID=403677 RepID=D0NLN1_PHYIT|nr:uncharacterized protein PITG_13303 [Phytophthora infestans T30-4]EEY60578.1 conserved hypothetical protein [Phytophthora infestans T30-4]|eukprot:XP_002899951.1 conserved hypothetical protein [Phytophthora infestans T30-4]
MAQAYAVATARGDTLATQRCDLLSPENEYLGMHLLPHSFPPLLRAPMTIPPVFCSRPQPRPALALCSTRQTRSFREYNRMFFEGRLAGCEVKWSKRMTLCEPLLKLRPRSDMVNTLLHEMIHAYVFVATPVRDHDDHGPLFQAHMNRINEAAKTKITVFHTFLDEVDSYRQHIWQCNGPCRHTRPYFGLVKRSMNRAPGPTDRWWADHERRCGGSYSKIKEPVAFTAKQAKKREQELAREEKQKKKAEDAKAAPSVKSFFPRMNEDSDAKTSKAEQSTRVETKPPRARKKTPPQSGTVKRKKEHDGDAKSSDWLSLAFPSSGSAVYSADGDEDGYFLVGDIQALFQTPPTQQFSPRGRKRDRLEAFDQVQGDDATRASASGSCAVVDMTVSDSDGGSDNEQLQQAIKLSLANGRLPRTGTGEEDVVEIDLR